MVDERETQTTTTTKKQADRKEQGGTEAIVKGWELNDFVVHLSFLQLICKVPLTFKSNLKLGLSIILKQWELYESKHPAVECRCLKMWDLLSLLMCSSIPVFKSQKFRQYS